MTALPTRRLEAWRYTDLKPLAAISFAEPGLAKIEMPLPDLGLPRLVFVNGSYNAALSTPPENYAGFTPVAETSALPMALINAAQARDGATLHIPAGVDAGAVLLVSYANATTPVAFHPRHRVTLGENARLTLIEVSIGQGVYWHNPVFDVAVAAGATLGHFRLQDESALAYHIATIRAEIAENAAYESFSLVMGASLSRAEFHAVLHGAGGIAHLNAAQLLGARQHADFTSVVGHKAPGCASRQTVKSVLSGHARGVFQGRIEVDRIAQKTDGYQMNQALLLSPHAEIDIKPELEIFADDVKCSHGATVGALDAEQIFYLRSRGIGEDEARAMLIRAFLAEALEPVTHNGARALLDEAIDRWWARK